MEYRALLGKEMANTFDWSEYIAAPERESAPKSLQVPAGDEVDIVRLLIAHRIITEEQFESLLADSDEHELVNSLVERGLATTQQVLKVRAAHYGISSWSAAAQPPETDALALVSGSVCRAHMVLPLKTNGKLLVLAMANPESMGAIEAVRKATGMRVQAVLADESELVEQIEKVHGVKALRESFSGMIHQAQRDFNTAGISRKEKAALTEADTRPVVGLVNHLLAWAIRMGASDVHIEPRATCVDVRFRIDGEMQKMQEIPADLMPMLTTRLKIMAELDIVETRMPQDGRMSVKIDGRTVDLRVSVLPNQYGPRIVLRILDRSISLKTLDELGFSETEALSFRRMLQRPYGLLLVTGPTGSGKTTTLYAALKELHRSSRNIMTCEDPIEYELDGINQSQVNEKVGLTFAAQLRATLRQDPDIILVGEIRDKETAETAIRAALTGHFVLSTLHCNDAPSALPRLLDMGVDPYLLSTCLVGITAQRLLRTVCPKCAVHAENEPENHVLTSTLGLDSTVLLKSAVGCPHCFGTGYRGRVAVHEMMSVGSDLADAIASRAPIPRIVELAAAQGYEPLQVQAMELVLAGQTTLSEATRLIGFDIA